MNIYTNIRMKLLKQPMIQINMKVALSTMNKTHYETLGVSPTATHNEIKSAYYKLTFKYHPDRNKSESAKQMFQEVSNAYNVVGNYQSRKRYDRTIAVTHKKENIVYKPVYRQTNSVHNSSGTHKIYDFDEWTRQHYQTMFENDMRKKWMKKNREPPKTNNPFLQLMVGAIIITVWFAVNIIENHDVITYNKKK